MKNFNLLIMTAAIAAFCVFAGGCGNSEVNIVRNGTLKNFRNLTIGEAMENYKYFKDTKWRFLKTANGKRVVEFKGSYDVNQNIFKNTDYQQFYLLMQFTLNVNNSFELTYLGAEDIYKNGKIKNRRIYSDCIENIYENKDTARSVAPPMLAAKLLRCRNGKYIGEILDNYKYLKSGKWVIDGYNTVEFNGVIKVDKDSKAAGVKKVTIELRNDNFTIEIIGSNPKDNLHYYVSTYDKKFDGIINGIAANKKIYDVLNPVEILKGLPGGELLVGCQLPYKIKISRGKDINNIIASSNLSLSEMLKLAEVVERKLFVDFKMGNNIDFYPQKFSVEDKYKNGSIKRYDVKVLDGEALELDPVKLLENSDCDRVFKKLFGDYYNEYDSKFLGGKSGRIFFAFIKYNNNSFHKYSEKKNYHYFYELIAIVSFDVNGENPKFEKVVMRCHNGKIIPCSTEYQKETKLPNPFYYIEHNMKIPHEWFKDYVLVEKNQTSSRSFPDDLLQELVEGCKKKNQNLEAFKTIFPLETINTVSKLKED